MQNRSLINTVVTAAVVVVILPLLLAVAVMLGHAGLEATGGSGIGMFAPLGGMHVVAAAWIVLAVVIVAALVGLLVKDTHRQHA
jgi:hypothetical protein